MQDNEERHGPDGRGNRRLASETTPVEKGQDFATSTGTLDRAELSDISTEFVATRRSPTDNDTMADVTEKQTTSQETKVNPRRKKRTMMSKWTLDLKSASIVRPRRMSHTSEKRLETWTNLV